MVRATVDWYICFQCPKIDGCLLFHNDGNTISNKVQFERCKALRRKLRTSIYGQLLRAQNYNCAITQTPDKLPRRHLHVPVFAPFISNLIALHHTITICIRVCCVRNYHNSVLPEQFTRDDCTAVSMLYIKPVVFKRKLQDPRVLSKQPWNENYCGQFDDRQLNNVTTRQSDNSTTWQLDTATTRRQSND